MTQRKRSPRIDWFMVIVDLERCGMSWRDVGKQMGMSKGWVEHLKNSPGSSPRHDDGEALIELWCDATSKAHSEAPRERPCVYG